jgi:tetratricopeptide (TPR) repeat protein
MQGTGKASPKITTNSEQAQGRAGASVARLRIRFSYFGSVESETIEFGTGPGSASPTAHDFAEGLRTYARGMDAIEHNDVKQSAEQSEALDAMLWRLEASKTPAKDEDKDEENQKQEPKEDDPGGVLNLLAALSLDLRANILSLQRDDPQANQLFQKAIEKETDLGYSEPPELYRPEQESLGEAYLRTHQWQKARDAFERTLKERPKSGHALYGVTCTYAGAGD